MLTPPPQNTQPRITRQKALENQHRRLALRLAQFQITNRRYSWLRLGVFLGGIGATWLAAASLGGSSAGIVLLAALTAFAIVVACHRRLDGWTARFRIWHDLRADQLARMRIDWEHIPAAEALSPRTALDIDLDLSGERSLHQLVDQTVSREGSQRLAKWLAQPTPEVGQIEQRQKVVRELAGLPRFRDRLLLNLRLISEERLHGARLLQWLEIEYPARRLAQLLLVGSLLVLLNAVLFVLNVGGLLPAYWPFTLVIYLAVYLYSSPLFSKFLEAVVEVDRELDKFRALLNYLETYPYRDHTHLKDLCAPFCAAQPVPSVQLRRIKLVTAAVGLRSNMVLGFLLNLLLPWDFLFAYLGGKLRQQSAQTLPAWLDAWYTLDALCSLGDYAYLNPEYRFPEISPDVRPVFHAVQMGHPMIPIERRVCNDFTIPELGQVTLITGSNMAGKSTFIKTVGVNLCLAYAGAPVAAQQLAMQPFRLHSCIRISDSIVDGFSYFYAEVRCLRCLLDELKADQPLPLLYLIDEIFRGTNNRERLLGSRAYTQSLIGARGSGFIATHDLELANLAEQNPQVKNYHFRDRVEDRKLVFDFLIRPGPSPTTNALKIMQMEGLPVEQET